MVAGYSVNNAFIVLSIVVIFLVVVSIPRREKCMLHGFALLIGY